MKPERIVRVGENGALVGILSEPSGGADLAFVLLNAGLLHRVGPGRIYVNLARHLARAGFACVRFDVSGVGDSGFRPDGLPYHESRIEDARAFLDFVQAHLGIDRFVAVGICSGADHAFRVASADERVVGAFLVDAYTYPTRKRALYYYGRRFFRAGSWLNVITGKHPLWQLVANKARRKTPQVSGGSPAEFVVDTPPKNETRAQVRTLLDNDVALYFLYTASVGPAYTYSSQFYDMLEVPEHDRLRAEYWPDVDHLFDQVPHQARLIETVGEWSATHWPPA